MEPAEVEFLAEKEQITIVPNFSENKLYLISVGVTLYPVACIVLINIPPASSPGGIWSVQPLHADQSAPLAGNQPPTETEVSHCPSRLAQCRSELCPTNRVAYNSRFIPTPPSQPPSRLSRSDYLTEKKSEEAAESFFTAMPSLNYMEVSSLVLNKSVGTAPSHGSLPPHSCAPLRTSERSDCIRRKFLQRLRKFNKPNGC